MDPEDVAVLELSSFQLHSMACSPDVAVITNISPNHLDVHRSYAEYIAAKENIFLHQSPEDLSIFNADNDVTAGEARRAVGRCRLFSRQREQEDGVFLRGDRIVSRAGGEERCVMETADIRLPGTHNIENYMAAIAARSGCAVSSRLMRRHSAQLAPQMGKDRIVVITVSGRGDKDCAAIARYRGEDLHE